MKILGIDPGTSGGLAIINDTVTAYKMPVEDFDLLALIVNADADVIVLEHVWSSPQMGVTSAFSFGDSFGSIRMACVASGCQIELVTPQRWQKELGLKTIGGAIGRNGTSKKNRNKAKALELFPGLSITHATADALLLAEYGRRVFG